MTTTATPLTPMLAELVRTAHIDQESAESVAARGAETSVSPLKLLLDEGKVDKQQLVRTAATLANMRSVELTELDLSSSVTSKLTGEHARRLNVLPYEIDAGGNLLVAVPVFGGRDVGLRDTVERLTKSKVEFVLADPADLAAKINSTYRADGQLDELTASMAPGALDDGAGALEQFTEAQSDDPVIRFVNELIRQAIRDRASDIHIEPQDGAQRVRFRIDGVLHVVHTTETLNTRIANRIKVMAKMDISNQRSPQDGRLSVPTSSGMVDLRVSTLPTVTGAEKIVMRILDNSQAGLSLAKLGFSDDSYATFAESFHKPHGMVLVTGPTGSGKSTTLYATLNEIVSDAINIVTVEDPVEYRLAGVNQVQVNATQGRGFAQSLRAILRQDPDVILLGEIRDEETAEIAVTAALTGHLVLATLHTNDAASVVTRLGEMGVAPYLVGDAVDCVVAQRLARRLCDRCRAPYTPTPEELAAVEMTFGDDEPVLYRPQGCPACSHTGFRGRVAIVEVMRVDAKIAAAAGARASAAEIGTLAIAQGMRPLRLDGLDKAKAGLTTVDEVVRIAV